MRLALLFLPLVLFLALASSLGAAEPQGAIEGQVVNRTPGGASVAGQLVTLRLTAPAGHQERSTQADAQGRFRFDGLETDPIVSYQALVVRQEAEYSSEELRFDEGETVKSLEISVWDAATSAENILVERHEVLVELAEGKLMVWEYLRFNNSGDHTYVGAELVPSLGKKATLRFSLADEAEGLTYLAGLSQGRVARVPGGLADTIAVMPGIKEVVFQYVLPARRFTFFKEFYYPVDFLGFLVQGVPAASDSLIDAGPVTVEGRTYQHLVGQGFLPGQPVRVRLYSGPNLGRQESLRWLALGVGVLALGAGLSYRLLRRRSIKEQAGAERSHLLQALADLDDQHEAGSLSSEEYQQRRAEVKARLVALGPPDRPRPGKASL